MPSRPNIFVLESNIPWLLVVAGFPYVQTMTQNDQVTDRFQAVTLDTKSRFYETSYTLLPLCVCYLPSLHLPRQRVESMHTKPCMSGHESVKDEMSFTVFVMNWCDLTYSNLSHVQHVAVIPRSHVPARRKQPISYTVSNSRPTTHHSITEHKLQKTSKRKVTRPRPRVGPGLGAARWIWIGVSLLS